MKDLFQLLKELKTILLLFMTIVSNKLNTLASVNVEINTSQNINVSCVINNFSNNKSWKKVFLNLILKESFQFKRKNYYDLQVICLFHNISRLLYVTYYMHWLL